jgi:isopenicillin N synthase-like dioxygenase
VCAECEATGFLAVAGHGVDDAALRALFAAARVLFDRPLADKRALVVEGMARGRGYEISPEHREFMQAFAALRAGGSSGGGCGGGGGASGAAATAAAAAASAEPSARDGILSERFLCGPPLGPAQLAGPDADYYTAGLGPVFFTPDAWPAEAVAPGLRAGMQGLHRDMSAVAAAALALMAAALGLPRDYFEPLTQRACSNLQARAGAGRRGPRAASPCAA